MSQTVKRAMYRNPVLDADWPDPDAIRVGDRYYLVASSFNRAPGLPLLTSADLVEWELVGHALPHLPLPEHFALPRHGCGVWAPALRHHAGRFWIFFPDPDHGIYVTSAADFTGPWDEPHLLLAGRGLIDPCPLWDDDGSAYLVHAWAKSRAGVKNRLTLHRMAPDATRVLDAGTVVIDGDRLPGYDTLEGPKLYRRDGWYWIFAPAGGVATGWQSAFRSRSPWGPYEERIVLAQGDSDINGPHQGAWVTTPDGADWFLHFQDRGVFGRVVHLQPMTWGPDGWPLLGTPSADGPGRPVREHPAPSGPPAARGRGVPTGDAFLGTTLGPQWHWQATPRASWSDLPGDGTLVLHTVAGDPGNLRELPHVLGQRLPGVASTTTTRLRLEHPARGARAGIVVLGREYAWLGLECTEAGCVVTARSGGEGPQEEPLLTPVAAPAPAVDLQVTVDEAGTCTLRWRTEADPAWRDVPERFRARPGGWIGAEIGLFATAPHGAPSGGRARFSAVEVDLRPDGP